MADFWNRAEAKRRAKDALRNGSYGKGLGVRFIIFGILALYALLQGILQGGFYLASVSGIYGPNFRQLREIAEQVDRGLMPDSDQMQLMIDLITKSLPGFLILLGVILLISILFRLLVHNPLEVGSAYWFTRNREMVMPPVTGAMWQPFRDGRYGKTIGGAFWRDLWLFIWSIPAILLQIGLSVYLYFTIDGISPILEFRVSEPDMPLPEHMVDRLVAEGFNITVVAGIVAFLCLLWAIVVLIRHYAYRLNRFLLADNPQLGARKALTLSRRLMHGNKGKLFVLDISFIGY